MDGPGEAEDGQGVVEELGPMSGVTSPSAIGSWKHLLPRLEKPRSTPEAFTEHNDATDIGLFGCQALDNSMALLASDVYEYN
jgi:hypothetical protein